MEYITTTTTKKKLGKTIMCTTKIPIRNEKDVEIIGIWNRPVVVDDDDDDGI